jgi:surface carbohydrate biosynthesis protein
LFRTPSAAAGTAAGTLSTRRILYLPMEISSRELDSRLLLAVLALARGFEVVLGQKWLIERNVESMPPGVYLSKTLTQRDARTMARAKELGYVVAAIEEEVPGLVTKPDELRWISDDAVRSADAIFVGGDNNANSMTMRFGAAADRIHKTLNPRWDLLRPNMRGIYQKHAEEIRGRFGRFLLVNTNLGWTNSEKGPTEFMIQEQARQGKIDLDNPATRVFLDSFLKMERDNHAAVVGIVQRVLDHVNDIVVVLRPHPSERIETWIDHFQKSKRLFVVREGASIPWIMASDALIHTNCTTGVEAMGLDRPALCVQATDSLAVQRYLANRVNPVARSVDEATDMILRHVAGETSLAYTDAMRNEFTSSMSFDPDRLGADMIIARLDEIVAARSKRPAGVADTFSEWQADWNYQWNLKDKNVRGTLFPDFSNDQIMNALGRISAAVGVAVDPTIHSCGSKVVLLTQKKVKIATRLHQHVRSKILQGRVL